MAVSDGGVRAVPDDMIKIQRHSFQKSPSFPSPGGVRGVVVNAYCRGLLVWLLVPILVLDLSGSYLVLRLDCADQVSIPVSLTANFAVSSMLTGVCEVLVSQLGVWPPVSLLDS